MKKGNIALELLKILGAFLAGCLLWLLIFSTFMPPDETGATTEPFPGAICVLGIVSAFIVVFIVNYNSIQRAYQKTKSTFSNITVFKERTARLLEKANKVANKYMTHEADIQLGVAQKRSVKPKFIRNAQQFQMEVENYPDLKANENIATLITQIRDTENSYAQAKINYPELFTAV